MLPFFMIEKYFYRKSQLYGKTIAQSSIIQSRVLCPTVFSLLGVMHAIFNENKREPIFSCMLTIEYV